MSLLYTFECEGCGNVVQSSEPSTLCVDCAFPRNVVPGDTSRTCRKCRRVVNGSSRYFRSMPRSFECESCLDGDVTAAPEVATSGIGVVLCSDCGVAQVDPPPRCAECWDKHRGQSKPLNAHYKHGSIDPCQYVEAMGDAEYRGACILNILKYITRYPHKGTPMEDLMKAQDYVNMLIEHQKKKENQP